MDNQRLNQQSRDENANGDLESQVSPNLPNGRQVERKLHQTIKKVTGDMEQLRFNTSIAALMELLNTYYQYQKDLKKIHLEQFLLMLAPFSPHVAEELWQTLRIKDKGLRIKSKKEKENSNSSFQSVHLHPWPKYDPKLLEEDEVTIVIQVNGKVRDSIMYHVSGIKYQDKIEQLVREREKVKRHLEGKTVKKVIYVEGKILNFVTQ